MQGQRKVSEIRGGTGIRFGRQIRSLNYQLRKVTKNRGHFPSDESAIKMLWLAICNIEDKRARDRAKERGGNRGTKHRPKVASSKAKS